MYHQEENDYVHDFIVDIVVSGGCEFDLVYHDVYPHVIRMTCGGEIGLCFSYKGTRYLFHSTKYLHENYTQHQHYMISDTLRMMVLSGNIEQYLNIRFLL